MAWTPRYKTHFIETVRASAEAIAVRDQREAIAYYNAEAGAPFQLTDFKRIVNTRFSDLFFPDRFNEFPVLIVSAETLDTTQEDYFDSAYSLTCEVWTVGSDPFQLRSVTERYVTVIAQIFLTASGEDFLQGRQAPYHSRVVVSIGRVRLRNPIRAASSNAYQDMAQIPLTISFLED